jgi:hypothetical protein
MKHLVPYNQATAALFTIKVIAQSQTAETFFPDSHGRSCHSGKNRLSKASTRDAVENVEAFQ